jgi:hypothetical protein
MWSSPKKLVETILARAAAGKSTKNFVGPTIRYRNKKEAKNVGCFKV